MSLEAWQAGGWSNMRVGQAVFDVKPERGEFSTYHAMLVASGDAEPTTPERGIRIRVVHMTGDAVMFGDDPEARHEIGPGNFLGCFAELPDGRHGRVADAMR